MGMLKRHSAVVALVGALVLTAWGAAEAQMRAGSAEVTRVTGRVEMLPKAQSSWLAATTGAHLVEGDQVRAQDGGSADLSLADGSTILVAENTRIAITKLDFDPASRDRDTGLHLVAGKVRAQVSQAAVTLVRARQSNFTISTPNGVAAIRGTVVIAAHNPATGETLMFVFPSPGQPPAGARASFTARTGSSVLVPGGNFVRHVSGQPVGQPIPVSTLPASVQAGLNTGQNPSTRGSGELTNPNVSIPSHSDTLNLSQGSAAGGDDTETSAAGSIMTTTGSTGSCSGCGQDVKSNIKPTMCGSNPC